VYGNVTSEKSYSFQVCAVRTAENGAKIQSPFSPVLSLTIPFEVTQIAPIALGNQASRENHSQLRKLSEKQLAGIFFLGFAFVVFLISLLVSFLVS
jgi:hypothetical protein